MSDPAVGARVVLRYRLPDGSSPPLTDVIGRLDALGDSVTVVPESGETVTVPRSRVVALKALNARPVRNSEIRALEHAAALAWPGTEQEWIGGWFLRAGDGVTQRANSAVPLLPDASAADLPAIESWYRARNLTPRLSLPDRLFRPPPGWALSPDVLVLTLVLAPFLADRTRVVRQGGVREPSMGAGTVTTAPDGRRWLGIDSSLPVVDAKAWGTEEGATHAYVQVEESNADALRLYGRLGFTEHHRYRYAESGSS